MKEKTLVILAAGMGSRFGGLKQVEPVDDRGDFIIDYSIYSAVKYGFKKIVIIIKKENYELFKDTVGSRIENYVKVEYAFQELDVLPEGIKKPEERIKPWGTAHALYCAKDKIDGPFVIITADDFYGDEAFKCASEFLDKEEGNAVIGYKIGDTLSLNGSVKRGVVMHEGDRVTGIIESSCIKEEDKVKCTPLDKSKKEFYVEKDHPVSMLMYVLSLDILDLTSKEMEADFKVHENNLMDYEMLLPDVLDNAIKGGIKISVIKTNSKWMGVTYKADLDELKEYISGEINKGVYPSSLWEKQNTKKHK